MSGGQRHILIIDGHPDDAGERLVHALSATYAAAAEASGHAVRMVRLAALDLKALRCRDEWEAREPPAVIYRLQHDLLWAEHVVLLFPLWLGDMPAQLKALLEQLLRPGYAFLETGSRLRPRLGHRSARIIVTMGMPALIYRLWFGAPVVRLLRRSILGLVGIRPVRATLFGNIEGKRVAARALGRVAALGRHAR